MSVSSKESVRLEGTWRGSDNPGKYYARGVLYYDGEQRFFEEVFELGEKNVEVSSLEVESYNFGGVSKLIFRLRNTWNQRISSTHAEFEVLDSNNNVVRDFRSITTSLEPYASEEMEVFWDTSGLEPGNYDLKINLFFDGDSSTLVQPVFLDFEEMRFRDGPFSGLVTGAEDTGNEYFFILLVVVVLIALNVALFLYVKRTMKKK